MVRFFIEEVNWESVKIIFLQSMLSSIYQLLLPVDNSLSKASALKVNAALRKLVALPI